ncbi:MAG: DUF3667 domain-containing protein [Marinoscillum sp.]
MSNLIQEEPTHCKNCGQTLYGEFCSQCGQSARVRRITFKDTFNHFLSSAFAFEGPYVSTIRKLLRNPGAVFRDYCSGKRKQFYQPVAFFILNTAIYLLIRSWIDFNPMAGRDPSIDLSQMREMQLKLYEAGRYMVDHINNILFLLVFSIGISNKIFFNKRYNLAEYSTYGFYLTGLYILLGVPLMLVSKYVTFIPSQANIVVLFGVLFYASYSLFLSTSLWAIIKYLFVTFLSILLYMILGFGLSFLIVYLG